MCHRGPKKKVDAAWLFQAVALLAALGSARATDYYVDPTSNSAYATVQSAVDAVSGQSEFNRANIFIAPGTYHELVTVGKPYVSLIGEGDSPQETTITFAVTVSTGGNFNWGQVVEIQSSATAFMARNLTFDNSTADKNLSPALALRSVADRAIFDHVRVLGYQDTLLADESSRQYFRGSFVTGDADFIFGSATAVFDHCTIESTDYGWVTASSTNRTTANGFVFLDCSLVPGTDRNPALDDRTSALPGTVYLGRPWLWWEPARMPSVIFIRTRMGRHIISAGWDPWDFTGIPGVNPNVNRDPLTRLSEFDSMDSNGVPLLDSNADGTPTGRVSWADPMTAEQAANYTLDRIFGPVSFWNSETQPETSGIPYESQGEDWRALAQLALLPTQSGLPSQPLNISTRVSVQTGDNVLIAGFILTGTAPKPVLLRAIGPSLASVGIPGALADPVMELHAADGTLIALNDNWQASEGEILATGIPPPNPNESAISITLPPGAYTAVVKGSHETTGVALVEVYDLDSNSGTQLGNISTRGFIEGGDHVMIAGFILAGGTGGSRVMIRAIGPTLGAAGIAGALADPTLELHDGNGISIAFSDNWKDAQQTEIAATKIPPGDDRESAIVASLPPGPYTAVLASRDGGTGIGVIEVYNLGR